MRAAAAPKLLTALLLTAGLSGVRSQAFATAGGAVQVCNSMWCRPCLGGASFVT